MTAKKDPPKAFTSFAILSKRAQELLRRARERKRLEREQESTQDEGVMPTAHEPDLRVAFSSGNIAKTTLTIIAVIVGGWLLFQLRDTIILLLLALFVAAIIDPGVQMLEKWNVPRGLGILLHYLIAVLLVVFLLVSLIPIIAEQLQQIALLISAQVDAFLANPQVKLPLLDPAVNTRLTELTRTLLENLSIDQFADALRSFGQNLASFAGGSFLVVTRIGLSVVGFFVRLVIVLVLAFFIQIEKERIRSWMRSFFPSSYRRYIDQKLEAAHLKIGKWARGQMLLGLVIGTLVFTALVILRIPYALTLAVLAGFTEFLPYVGPFIAAIPAVLIALTQGGFVWALIIAGVYYAIQWCENNLLVPLIMKRAVGLSPIAIISAMMIGVSFPDIIHPILGILLAVPTTTIIALFLEDWRITRKENNKN